MNADGDCLHGMTREWCADCTGRDGGAAAEGQRRKALISSGRAIAADYPGVCVCGEWFAVGDPISRNRSGVWESSCCIDEARL